MKGINGGYDGQAFLPRGRKGLPKEASKNAARTKQICQECREHSMSSLHITLSKAYINIQPSRPT